MMMIARREKVMMLIKASDPRIKWHGAVSLQYMNDSVKPWRIDYNDLDLFYSQKLIDKAANPSGVRMCFSTNAGQIRVNLSHKVDFYRYARRDGTFVELPHCLLETTANGKTVNLVNVPDEAESVMIDHLPEGNNDLEIWLPPNCQIMIHSLELPDNAFFEKSEKNSRPLWIIYGSSITHCVRAESPTKSWPAIAAAELNLNFISLGFGAQCKLDTSIAMMIRDMSADLISLKLGINVCNTDLSPRTFGPAVVGMVRIIREKHRHTPLILCSPIFSPPHETTPGITGLSLEVIRKQIAEIVEIFRRRNDKNIYYINGLEIFGPELEERLLDLVHPDADGIKQIGYNFAQKIRELNL